MVTKYATASRRKIVSVCRAAKINSFFRTRGSEQTFRVVFFEASVGDWIMASPVFPRMGLAASVPFTIGIPETFLRRDVV